MNFDDSAYLAWLEEISGCNEYDDSDAPEDGESEEQSKGIYAHE